LMFFQLLDLSDGDSRFIDCEDFLMGCTRLKGSAKALHLAQLAHETKKMHGARPTVCCFFRSKRMHLSALLCAFTDVPTTASSCCLISATSLLNARGSHQTT